MQDGETTTRRTQVEPADVEEEDHIAQVSLVFALNKISNCLNV